MRRKNVKYDSSVCLDLAFYMINEQCTVRQVSSHFKIPKSSVHHILVKNLPEEYPTISKEVKKVLATNLSLRHIRGGLSTKSKYSKRK